jgi:hypothetical protein
MKQILILLIVVAFSCTKPDSSKYDVIATPQQPDTGAFVIFTLHGDSFNEERIVINGEYSACSFSGTTRYIAAWGHRNGYRLDSHFYFKLDTTGTVGLDSLINISNFRFYGTNIEYYLLTSFAGKFTITHYPDSINEYIKGSFSGSYLDKTTRRPFKVTNGIFRIKRVA